MNDKSEQIAKLAAVRGPLAGVLVVELTGGEPSGLGTQILADLGATVFKIERPPEGAVAPFEIGPGDKLPTDVAFFCGLNRNKRSLCLDLKRSGARSIFHRLIAIADVLYDNYKPGVTARLEADYGTLKAINPGIICCSVTGFGHTGPMSQYAAYDVTIQAMGGGMSITGTGKAGTPPVRWGNPIAGLGGALYAVIGILSALRRRRCDPSNGGAWVDISMLDTQLAMHAYRVPPAMSGRKYVPQPMRGGTGSLPYGPFMARDQRWFVLGTTFQFWEPLCRLLSHPEWIDDPRFNTQKQRQANEKELNALVSEAMLAHTADEWQTMFVKAGIPGAKVRTIPEAFEHPHVRPRDMLEGFGDGPLGDRVKVAGNPIKMSCFEHEGFRHPPGLGEDSKLILEAVLGLSQEDCGNLRNTQVTWWPDQGTVYARRSIV